MNPLIVKGVVFGLLLACAALWDMKEREIPNLIPAMILVCGLIELRPRRFCGGASCYGRSVPVGCITDTWESLCHWRWGH